MLFAFTRSHKQAHKVSGSYMAYLYSSALVAGSFFSQQHGPRERAIGIPAATRFSTQMETEVRIAGINWYGFETPDYLVHGLWAQDYHTVLNTIKSLGYNVIRIPFSNQMVESNPVPTQLHNLRQWRPVNQALVGQTALADLDTIVAYAGSIGLRVILDNHRSEAGESNEANGLWYTSAYPQANWIADWQTMATRYSASTFTFNGNPTVIGMDLRNEPHLSGSGATTGSCWTGDTATNGCPTSLTAQNWPVAAEAAGNAILAINPKLLIFVEGNDCYSGVCGWQGGNLIGVATNPVTLSVANQLVYSAHDYGPNLYQQPWFNSSTTTASLDAIWNKYWGYISADGTAPVWLGEFGTDNTSTRHRKHCGRQPGTVVRKPGRLSAKQLDDQLDLLGAEWRRHLWSARRQLRCHATKLSEAIAAGKHPVPAGWDSFAELHACAFGVGTVDCPRQQRHRHHHGD